MKYEAWRNGIRDMRESWWEVRIDVNDQYMLYKYMDFQTKIKFLLQNLRQMSK